MKEQRLTASVAFLEFSITGKYVWIMSESERFYEYFFKEILKTNVSRTNFVQLLCRAGS